MDKLKHKVHFVRSFDCVFNLFCALFFIDPEKEIIEHYFHLGYKYDVIVSFMRSRHDICMDVRTLKCTLVSYKLSRNESWRNKKVKNLIKEEMRGSELVAWRVTGKCSFSGRKESF